MFLRDRLYLVYLSRPQWHEKPYKVGLRFNKPKDLGMVSTKLDGLASHPLLQTAIANVSLAESTPAKCNLYA